MECMVPSNNIKVLGKALQSLSKVGDELFMEVQKNAMSLISMNLSKTVCGKLCLNDGFFSCYNICEKELQECSNATITCKVQMKTIIPLFKGNLEKKLDYLKIEFHTPDDFIVLKLKYKSDDILMTHKLHLMDDESLAFGSTLKLTSTILAPSKLFNQVLSLFSTSDNELIFEITSSKITARNYFIGAPCRPKMVRSQIELISNEFQSYSISEETTINISLKPFRTIVQFAEAFHLNIGFNFQVGGQPMEMIVASTTFEINFKIATLNPYAHDNSPASGSLVSVVSKPVEISESEFSNWDNNDFPSANENIAQESPRRKKMKDVFVRCYDQTFHKTMLGEVLTANSDSD